VNASNRLFDLRKILLWVSILIFFFSGKDNGRFMNIDHVGIDVGDGMDMMLNLKQDVLL
jgi:hypothetical protein